MRKKHNSGFTLVELILYVALVSIFMVGAILFSWDVIYGREKSIRQQVVQQNARIAMAKIGNEIERANDISSIAANQIVLTNTSGTTTINLSGGRIRITSGGGGPFNITSNQVTVTSLAFTNLQSTNQNTNNIRVSITLTQANSPIKGELTSATTLEDSFELKGEFNQARRLLISTSLTAFPGGTSVQGMTAENTSSGSIVIDKMFVSWTGVPASRRITSVQIQTGTVEWTGSAASGTLLELTNHTIATALTPRTITITFDADMTGAILDYYFVMSDGSFAKAKISLVAQVIYTCGNICETQGYTGWTCRASAAQCTSNSEINVSAGNSFCTGGTNGDTCCCN